MNERASVAIRGSIKPEHRPLAQILHDRQHNEAEIVRLQQKQAALNDELKALGEAVNAALDLR